MHAHTRAAHACLLADSMPCRLLLPRGHDVRHPVPYVYANTPAERARVTREPVCSSFQPFLLRVHVRRMQRAMLTAISALAGTSMRHSTVRQVPKTREHRQPRTINCVGRGMGFCSLTF